MLVFELFGEFVIPVAKIVVVRLFGFSGVSFTGRGRIILFVQVGQ